MRKYSLSLLISALTLCTTLPNTSFADDHEASQSSTSIDEKIDMLAEELEKLRIGKAAIDADQSIYGMGPAASKVYRKQSGLSVGGYGEMKYVNYADTREDGQDSGRDDTTDLHRIILYTGYKYNETFVFNAEIEFEHVDELAVEFAYVDALLMNEFNVRAGHILMPMGMINELHEPTTFFSASRPEVERRIIPSTWHENGIGVFGALGPVDYRAYVVGGLDASSFSSSGIRSGRQKGSSAIANNLAYVLRADYTGVLGLTAGGSVYYGAAGQGITDPTTGSEVDANTLIYELHADWEWRGLHVRGLAAFIDISDVAALNRANGLTGADSIGEHQEGYYIEAGYNVLNEMSDTDQALVPFLRWEHLNTQTKVPNGFARNLTRQRTLITAGVNYRPMDQLVVKADYVNETNEAETGVDALRLTVGYIF